MLTKHDIFDLPAVYEDKRTLTIAKRYKDYNSIRRDLREAYSIVNTIISAQHHPDLSVLATTVFSLRAQLLYAIIQYTRWFKSTNHRKQLNKRDFFVDNTSKESKKHDELINLRDKYIAHPELDILGGDRIWAELDAGGEIRISSDFCIQIIDKPDEIELIRRCIEIVHNKIDKDILPGVELRLKKCLTNYSDSLCSSE